MYMLVRQVLSYYMCFHIYHISRFLQWMSIEGPEEKKILIGLTPILFPTSLVPRIQA